MKSQDTLCSKKISKKLKNVGYNVLYKKERRCYCKISNIIKFNNFFIDFYKFSVTDLDFMNTEEILKRVDHTVLAVDATWEDIRALCDEGIKYNVASVCIPASFVKRAKEYVGDKLKICTVIGFPNGYSTTKVKVYEASDAVANGADEVDMVINIGDLKDKNYQNILNEINEIKDACDGRILKVIIETCLLSQEEKVKMCQIVSDSKADYIKTSTGFSTGGATREDIELFASNVYNDTKIKAAGGVRDLKTAEEFINLGSDRLGTSSIVKIIKGMEVSEY